MTKEKKSIPFFDILKQAAQIVWQNRFLLWFGLLMALGSPGSFNIGENENNLGAKGEAAKVFFENHWPLVLAIVLVLFAIGIILFLISLVAKAGLIKSADLIARNKKTNFKEGWRSGRKYLGRLFGLGILVFLATLLVVVVLAVPIIYLVAAKSYVAAILVGLLAIAIFIPLMFVFSLTKVFAEFYIILSNLHVRNAIETGYDLLLKNIANSIIFWLLLIAVSIVAGLVLLPVAGIALVILIPTGIAFYYLSKITFAIFIVIAVLLFLAVILFVSSIFQAYRMTAWTLFFREIAKVEKPETVDVFETEAEKSIAATPASPTNLSESEKT